MTPEEEDAIERAIEYCNDHEDEDAAIVIRELWGFMQAAGRI